MMSLERVRPRGVFCQKFWDATFLRWTLIFCGEDDLGLACSLGLVSKFLFSALPPFEGIEGTKHYRDHFLHICLNISSFEKSYILHLLVTRFFFVCTVEQEGLS